MPNTDTLERGRRQPHSPSPDSAASHKGLRGHPWLTLIAVALGVMMVSLDGTVVAIANPSIAEDLGASMSDLQWVTNGYLLALAVFLIPAGKLGDRYGHRTIFLTGAVGFALTSVAIGVAGNITALIALRVFQGVFGAMLQPTALGLLRSSFPGDKLNMAIGIWAAAISSASAAGPIVGGLLVENVGWESVFFINAPVGLIAVAVGLAVLADTREPGLTGRIDLPGVALLSGAMFSLVWGVIKSGDHGWTSAYTIGFLAAAVVLLVLFALWQGRASEPLMPLALFRNRSFSAGIGLMLVMAFAMFGALFFLTFYLIGVGGLSPVEAGVRMLPLTLMMMLSSGLAGALVSKLGPRVPIIGGLAVSAAAMFWMGQLGSDASLGATAPVFALLGLGLSPIMVAATDVIVGNAPVALAGVASGIQQAAMQVGGALGTAILGAVMSAKVASSLPGHWAAEGLGPLSSGDADKMKSAVAQGFPPVDAKTPVEAVPHITDAAHASFLDGMHLAFTLSGIALVCAIVLALLVRAGEHRDGSVSVHV
ncbi:MFS transporter [Yinghuangia seranimata]|uniref:MFS transporter n=1 Tax=Yinghuangia seranimata TaxID=408067 RepID=UPI00248B83FF|nr:MFS transporter [Yinghuangia seranimata]MDI2126415.1 MFS transporter [Yinghuangia seranimata]